MELGHSRSLAVAVHGDDANQIASVVQALTRQNGASQVTPEAVRALIAQRSQSAEGDGDPESNGQNAKELFLAKARAGQTDDYLKSTRTAPLSRYEIKAGWEIPAVLEQALNSDLPGELKALVSSNVYDTASGRYLLIPQGSRLVGVYNSRIGYGQDGVQVIWDRVIYPDGSSLDLSGMIGQDAHGFSGFRDKVDRHYTRLIGFAVLTSLFAAASEISQNQNRSLLTYPSPAQVAGSAVGQQASDLGRANHETQPERPADDQGRRRISLQRQSKPGHPFRCSLYACFSQPMRPSSKLSEPNHSLIPGIHLRSHSDSVRPTRDSLLAYSFATRWACSGFKSATQRYLLDVPVP